MKRSLLSMISIVIGLTAFSQSPSRFISLRPAYPVAIGESTIDDVEFSSNGLYMYDILQDSLPQYEIGQIFAQTVSYTEDGHGFYIKADSLHSLNVVYSCEVNDPPQGAIEFNETTGRFKYYPAAEDYKSFVVTFSATNGMKSVSEDVTFNLMPQTAPEMYAFQTQGVMPDAGDYTIVAETSKSLFLNNEQRTAYSISISGKDVVFDDAVKNKVYGMNGREDIYELNIYAERLVIRSSLSFPQTNITIYAKELVFEDHDTVFAYINTTPSYKEFLTDGAGANGANAGDITLYVKEFKGNVAKRLILNGAKGQSTNRNGTPGNGGNGGTLTSTIDVSSYCDFARGSAGVRYDVAADGSDNAGTVIASGSIGVPGHFELIDRPYAYIHPNYISAILRQVNDAFINNYLEYAYKTCRDYRNLIEKYESSSEWENCNTEEQAQLQNNLIEMGDMLFKLEQGLDYFGNPKGWVPLLSFEVLLENYNNEIDRAIPTLYMNYWLSRVDHTLENLVAVQQLAVSNKEAEIQDTQNSTNKMVLAIPKLQDQIKEVETEIEIVNQRINEIEARLMAKAKRSVKKKNRIKKAGSICRSIANAVSVCGSWGAAIGTAMNVASNIAFASNTIQQYTGIDTSPVNNFYNDASNIIGKPGSVDLSKLDSIISNIPWKEIGNDANMLSTQFKNINEVAGPLISNVTGLAEELSHSSTPQNEVEQVFNSLCSKDPEWNELKADLKSLIVKKEILSNSLQQTFADISAATVSISDGLIALDGLKRNVFKGNSKRDLNAMQYLAKMEQQAKNRLLKYYYYMRKAYEYRLLKPYEGKEFNLVGMFERFESLGMALGDVIDEAAYQSLGSIFREAISNMAEDIIDEYSANYPEQSAPISIVIPKEQLDIINNDESYTLNFHEMGVFAPDEENVRIVNLGIQHIETHIDGWVGYSGYMDLNMTHSGISQFRKDGQIYWFDHMSRTSTSPHTWGVRYDAVSNESTTIEPSAASASLLASILKNSGNIMLFSRPSAWGDINLSKKVHTSGGADIVIDSLVLRLQYDFTRRPNSLRNIDITANEDLLPYIACSAEDINGRTNGNGILYRSYRMSNQPVTFSAIEKYGTYHFLNWTDRSGKVVSDKADLTVNRQKDQFYVANYERRIPILNVTDTIRVSNEENEYIIYVNNIGSGDMEMDWYVSDSLSSWVHLNGITEGIDDGYFTFTVDDNTSGANRLDSLEIFAPETEAMSKMIYISQVNGPFDEDKIKSAEGGKDKIRIYPNPMQEFVKIEGEGLLSVCIYSITGKEMYRRGIDGSDTATIDVAGLPNGIYILSVNTRNGLVSKKMLKTN